MKDEKLRRFMEDIMDIQLGLPGMGSVSSGITGTVGTQGMVGEQMKDNALRLAGEYIKPNPDIHVLRTLAEQLEGSLLGARLINGISEAKLNKLLNDLHTIVDTKANG
jgi:hypothetical protein